VILVVLVGGPHKTITNTTNELVWLVGILTSRRKNRGDEKRGEKGREV
jgi:ribosomal protein L15E